MNLVILLFAMFASLFTLQKETLNYSQPFFLVGSRMVAAGIMLMAYVWYKNRGKKITINYKHVPAFVMLAISNIYLTNILEIWAIDNMVSSKACLIYSLSPFVAALVAFIILKEQLNPRKFLGMGIGFLGLLPIILMQTEGELAAGKFIFFSLAELSLVGAVFFSVYGWIMLKKIISVYDYSPWTANGISMLFGGCLALLHSYLAGENWGPVPVNNYQPFLINTLIMCVISNIVCYNLYGYLLKTFTATFMSFAGLVTPLFASLFGFVFLGEVVTWHYFASVVLFAFGLYLFYREEIKLGQAYKVKPHAEILMDSTG